MSAAQGRALHQSSDHPRVFTDPLAVPLAKAAHSALGEAAGDTEVPLEARLFLAMRHRFAEDTLARRADGLAQVVVLGAGLDTFGLRNPYPGVVVYEVDHPDTQAWKRQRITDAGIEVPDSLRFVAVDFESDSLPDRLCAAGFDAAAPTFFLWLGVVQYLSDAALDATLRFIAERPAPTSVVIDYGEPPSALPPRRRAMVEVLATIMEGIGEPWLSLFTANEIADRLAGFGLKVVEDLDWPAMIERFVPGSTAEDQVGAHVLLAERVGSSAHP
ncbi:class I SAM-dependent methyltransferase [Nocardia sp. NPDC006044]|uniref:class I SAM-dependent methyltransferase n=1 Tax=Nocardia sp. NPDC006044 TaxID=3364306 RepID=UPI0036CFB634